MDVGDGQPGGQRAAVAARAALRRVLLVDGAGGVLALEPVERGGVDPILEKGVERGVEGGLRRLKADTARGHHGHVEGRVVERRAAVVGRDVDGLLFVELQSAAEIGGVGIAPQKLGQKLQCGGAVLLAALARGCQVAAGDIGLGGLGILVDHPAGGDLRRLGRPFARPRGRARAQNR